MTDATEKIIEKIEEIIRDPSHSSSRAKAEAVYRCAHEWQPIETATRDGTKVLGYGPDGVDIVSWHDEQGDYYEGPVLTTWAGWHGKGAFPGTNFESDTPGHGALGQPTLWMPLPPTPKQETK